MSHISVCICTYKRPELLQQLLNELACQETQGRFTFDIVVADNDADESARPVVDHWVSSGSPLAVAYCVEPRQNIALARNTAIKHATGDFVAFFDDDQLPIRQWLLTLYLACERYGVDGVLGPVKPRFETPPPSWVVAGGFCERPTYATGFVIDWRKGRTGNVLLKRELFEGVDVPFRPEFLTGEDQDFFRRMIEAGGEFVWCNEAVAYEITPRFRWSLRFMLRRSLLRGQVSILQHGGRASAAKSLVAVPAYCVLLPFLLLGGYHKFVKYLVKLGDHTGRLLAVAGIHLVNESYVTK
jgi:glycosyltransferase involved in cell wall biosynthesis